MKFFADKLQDLREQNLYRSLQNEAVNHGTKITVKGKKYICFCSNDYLGLSQNADVKNAAISAIKKYGFGSGASRYVSGNNNLHAKLEKKLAAFKKTEAALLIGSGYLSGLGVISALVDKNDLIIADKLIHASLIDGAKLSGAKMLRFRHNDLAHCEELLRQNRSSFRHCLIITETVFSMDGDLGKIAELDELSNKYDAMFLTDDAHALGVVGWNYQLKNPQHLQLGTLSKAVGGYGGYVCSSNLMIDYLRNFLRPAIYSTALPPAVLAGNLRALEIVMKNKKLTGKALQNAEIFCHLMDLPSPQSAIVPIIIGDATETLQIAEQVKKRGFLISAIRPPTVEKNKARLRITFSALHKKVEITELAKVLKEILTHKI